MRDLMIIIENLSSHTVLWHGTSESPDDIRKHGLLPARHESVFLTDNPEQALDYAGTDQDRTGNEHLTVVTVDLSKLDMKRMMPDLDHTTVDDWQESLSETDQCMYQGHIPPEAILSIKEY